MCDEWSDDDSRKKKTLFEDIEKCSEFLNNQANELSRRLASIGGKVRAYVLDCTIT